MAQRNDFRFVLTIRTDNGVAPVLPSLATNLRASGSYTAPANWDTYTYYYENQAIIQSLLVDPAPAVIAPISLPNGGSANFSLATSNGAANLNYATAEAVASGCSVSHLGGGNFSVTVSEAARALVPLGQAFEATVDIIVDTIFGDPVQWPQLVISSTGTLVQQLPPGPQPTGETPVQRQFKEAAGATFTVDIASLFVVAAPPATYSVQNGDGSALSDFSLVSLVNGVATLRSPTAAGVLGQFFVRFTATDVNGKSAFVISAPYTVTANPAPQIIGAPGAQSRPIGQSGSLTFDLSALVTDDDALTTTVLSGDGSALPAGYTFGVAGSTLTLNFPTEGAATTRTFRFVFTEQSALAQSDFVLFTLDRTASTIVVSDASPQTVPENATTSRTLDFTAILGAGATAAAVTLSDGSPLPADMTADVSDPAAVVVTWQVDNNEIVTRTLRYSATVSGNTVQANATWSSVENPPVENQLNLSPLNRGAVTIDLVAASDDPAKNEIVPGSVSALRAAVVVNGDNVTLTPDGIFVGVDTLTYTLRVGASGPTKVCTQTINWRDYIEPVATANINATTPSGTTWAGVNVTSLFAVGSAPLNVASAEFVNTQTGARLGKTFTLTGLGTLTISAAGLVTANLTAGVAGTISGLSILIADANGVLASSYPTVSVSQTVTAPPPTGGQVYPSSSDGKAILQHGTAVYAWYSGEDQFNNDLLNNFVGFGNYIDFMRVSEIQSGKADPITGYIDIAPGETYGTFELHRLQAEDVALGTVAPGDRVILLEIVPNTGTGGSANTCGIVRNSGLALTESGSTSGVRRYVATYPTTGGQRCSVSITGGANGGRVKVLYIGNASAEGAPRDFKTARINRMARWKVLRRMDDEAINGSRVVEASQIPGENDYFIHGNSAAWGLSSPPTGALRTKLKAGFPPEWRFKEGIAHGGKCGLHFCLPGNLGWKVLEYTLYDPATYLNWPNGYNALLPLVQANVATIEADAFTEYLALGRRIANAAVAKAWPDDQTLFFERSNEVWNAAFLQTHYTTIAWAVAKYNEQIWTVGQAGLTAIMAKALDQAFREIKPNQSRIWVLGSQTVTDNYALSRGYARVNEYAANNGGRPASEFMAAITCYYEGELWESLERSRGVGGNPWGATTPQEAGTLAAAQYAADVNVYNQRVRDWYISPTAGGLNVQAVYNNHVRHRDVAIAAGLRGVMNYEGSCHVYPRGAEATFPGYLAALKQFHHGPYGKEVAEYLIQKLRSFNPINPAITTGFRDPELIIANYMWYGRNKDRIWPFGEIGIAEVDTQPATGMARAWDDALNGTAGGPPPPPPPPPSNFDLDLATNGSVSALATAYGFSFPAGTWTVTASVAAVGNIPALHSSSFNGSAQVAIRNTQLADKLIKFRVDVALISAGAFTQSQNDTIFRMLSTSNVRLELRRTASGNIELLAPYAPGDAETILLTTTGVNVTDLALRRLVVEYYSDNATGYCSIKLDDGAGNLTTLAERTNINSDPNNKNATFHTALLRYNYYFTELKVL